MCQKIDTRIEPHLRQRPAHWPPNDYYASNYFSEIIPEFYLDVSQCKESYSSHWTRHWLIENDKILKDQRNETSPVFAECCLGAAIDAREDMQDFDKQGRLDRRDAAIEAGNCSAEYTGRCKDLAYGRGVRGACNSCSGQVVKPGGTEYSKLKSRHIDSDGAMQSRIKSSRVYDGAPE